MLKLQDSGLKWLWLTLLVISLDRFTKILVQTFLMPYQPVRVLPFFELTLAYNKGAAFSFLNYASGWQTWFFACLAFLVSSILLIWLRKISSKEKILAIALTLIIGGALGNLWDRLQFGEVIDFLDVFYNNWHWPIFNIADSAICTGALLLSFKTFFSVERNE